MAKLQEVYLKDAMLLAFAAGDNVLAEVAGLPDKTYFLLRWLQTQTFDVAEDQGNDIQEKSLLYPEQRNAAKLIMATLEKIVTAHQCHIMTGYSANNEIMTVRFFKERKEVDIMFYGGLEEEVRYLVLGLFSVVVVCALTAVVLCYSPVGRSPCVALVLCHRRNSQLG